MQQTEISTSILGRGTMCSFSLLNFSISLVVFQCLKASTKNYRFGRSQRKYCNQYGFVLHFAVSY